MNAGQGGPIDGAAQRLVSRSPVAPSLTGLLSLCAVAIVIGGLYFGRELLIPLVLAILFAFVLAPVARWGQRWLYLGRALSVVLAVVAGFAVLLGVGLLVSRQAAQLVPNLPSYSVAVKAKLEALHLDDMLAAAESLVPGLLPRGHGRVAPGTVPEAGAPVVMAAPATTPASPLDVVLALAEPVLAPLATAALVVVFVIFTLIYREELRDRLIRLAGAHDLHRTIMAMNDAGDRLSRYFLAQVALNSGFGVFIGVGLWVLGVPNPVLWGFLAGLMRFVPFIGTPIAVLPPLLLALAVDPGWSLALWVLGLFLISEPLMGQVVEPLLYGHSTGLSPLSVIVAATFWAFLWGPVGLLLATPLTVCLVVLGRHVERLEFLDIMLGDRPPLQRRESFYQHVLEGDADGLLKQAREQLRTGTSLAAYVDEVALRGLALAQADWSREILEPARMESIRVRVGVLTEMLTTEAERQALAGGKPAAQVARPGPWSTAGAVVCIAGQGPFDELAATLAAEVLRRDGFGARAEPHTTLEAVNIERLDPERVRLCCLSVLEEGSSAASIRYLLRRLRRRLPEARLVIALWHAAADSPTLLALRAEGPGEVIATSVGEVSALCQAFAAEGVLGAA